MYPFQSTELVQEAIGSKKAAIKGGPEIDPEDKDPLKVGPVYVFLYCCS